MCNLISPLEGDLDIGFLTIHQFQDDFTVRSFESYATNTAVRASSVDSNRSRPDKFTEMCQIVIKAGISDGVFVAVDNHNRVLCVLDRVSVGNGNQPWTAVLIQDHIPVRPCRCASLKVRED